MPLLSTFITGSLTCTRRRTRISVCTGIKLTDLVRTSVVLVAVYIFTRVTHLLGVVVCIDYFRPGDLGRIREEGNFFVVKHWNMGEKSATIFESFLSREQVQEVRNDETHGNSFSGFPGVLKQKLQNKVVTPSLR